MIAINNDDDDTKKVKYVCIYILSFVIEPQKVEVLARVPFTIPINLQIIDVYAN